MRLTNAQEQPFEVEIVSQPWGLLRTIAATRRFVLAVTHYCRWRWRFAEFGWRSVLQAPDLLTNSRYVKIGRRVEIRKGARIEVISTGKRSKPALTIADGTSIHFYFHCAAASKVEVGPNVLIAGHVYITDHDHEIDHPDIHRTLARRLRVRPTIIEEGCWLGEGCKVLKGVRLGKGCVVGANAVVTRSFGPYSVVAGVPARIVRTYDADQKAWVLVNHEHNRTT